MKKLLKLTLTLLILNTLYLIPSNAQVGINNDNSEPDASAMLDVKSDSKGMLVPRMSSSQRTMISNAATGLLVFDTDTESFWFKSSTVWIELVDELSPMEHDAANDLVKPNEEIVDLATDDFVFGSPQLDDTGNADNDYRFFFDKSKGAFRAGEVDNTQWDDANIGNQSAAFGARTIASNFQTFAAGNKTTASGFSSVAFGNNTVSSGAQSFASGNLSIASGDQSLSIGNGTEATGNYSIALGNGPEASAFAALAIGNQTQALSFAETALGTFNTLYTSTNPSSWNTNDRLFVIGNGLDEGSRSDAFSILKNGNIALNGTVTIDSAYTLPSTDGSMGQILTTDGSGTANWMSNTLLQDADGDTKIQVEESADEDVIRFTTNGTERLSIQDDRLIFENSNSNIFIGDATGEQNTSGSTNIAIGIEAFKSNTIGELNVAYGASTLRNNTEGSFNTALGQLSLYENLEGDLNTAVGYGAGSINQNGMGNVFLGATSGGFSDGTPTDMNQNVMLGFAAGGNNTSDGNIFIGYQAGLNELGSNKLYLENSDSSTPLLYGEFDNDLVRINGDLEVTGNYPNTDNQTLTYNNTNKSLSISGGNTADLTQLAVPVGTIIMWIGDENETVPDGWLICDNRLYNTTTYPDLFALLGTNRTPNFLGRFPVGAPRDGINGATSISVGGTGGEEDKTLDVANLPPHSHDIKFREGEEGGGGRDYSDINAIPAEKTSTGSTELEGDGDSFKIMPPFLGVQFLIKAE